MRFLLALGVAAIAVAAVSPAQRAPASTACWRAVLNDWADGRFDGTYAPHCYTDALDRLPDDIRVYSSAEDDISRALAHATRRTASARASASVRPAATATENVQKVPTVQNAWHAKRVIAVGAAGLVAIAGGVYVLRRRSVRNVIE